MEVDPSNRVPFYVDAQGLCVLAVTAAVISYGIFIEDSPVVQALLFVAYVCAFAFGQVITRRK